AGATIANDGTVIVITITRRDTSLVSDWSSDVCSADLTNSGAVNAQGVINGPITNQNAGTFTVTGNLVGNSTFDNNDTATLNVTEIGRASCRERVKISVAAG